MEEQSGGSVPNGACGHGTGRPQAKDPLMKPRSAALLVLHRGLDAKRGVRAWPWVIEGPGI